MKKYTYMQIMIAPSDRAKMAKLDKKTDYAKYFAKKRAEDGDCSIAIKNNFYTTVAEINATNMENALHMISDLGNIGKTIKQLSPMSAAAFGDIIVNEAGEWYLIQLSGLRIIKKLNFGRVNSLELMPN